MNTSHRIRLGTVALALLWAATASAQQATEKVSAVQALERLKEGNERFFKDQMEAKPLGDKRRQEIAKGQHPFAIVLTCADSRLAPELIFNQGLGDLFVLRVAGNLTDPLVLGSMEYAVEHLHVPLILVLGHENCGAVAAALGEGHFPTNLQQLVQSVHVGKDLPLERSKALPVAIRNNVIRQISLITERSPLLKKEADEKKLRIVGGVYDLKTGHIEWQVR